MALAGVVVAAEDDGGVMPMATPVGEKAERGRHMQAYDRLWRLVDAAVARELAIREFIILALVVRRMQMQRYTVDGKPYHGTFFLMKCRRASLRLQGLESQKRRTKMAVGLSHLGRTYYALGAYDEPRQQAEPPPQR